MKQKLRSYAVIALGAFLDALGFNWFIAPNQFASGGVTGLAQAIHALCPPLTVGLVALAINIPLFLIGWRKIGGHLLVTSLFATTIDTLAIDAIGAVIAFPPMDPMLACLCGGALTGLGLGMVLSQGATTGGTDIVARLLKLRFPWLPMGQLLLAPDFCIMLLVAAVFGQVNAVLYGIVKAVVCTRVMDTVLYGLDNSRVAYIISDRWREIADTLMARQDHGVTILQGRGGYTGADKQVLLVAFRQREIVQIKRQVHGLDPRAFMIVCEAHDVLGEGFGDYQDEL